MPDSVPENGGTGRLAGRIALITGAGRGIGRAIAETFAQEGAHVYAGDVDPALAQETTAAITGAGGTAVAVRLDVTRADDITGTLARIEADHGRLDLLVNNAGVMKRSELRHMSDEDWVELRDVNIDGVFRLSRDAMPLLRASGAAAIINLSSIMALRAQRQVGAYCASKGAVSTLTKALAVEYAGFGIRVNALAPGFIETDMTARFRKLPPMADALIQQTPLRRFGRPRDIARAALFLASDDAAFITGEVLTVDGGVTALI